MDSLLTLIFSTYENHVPIFGGDIIATRKWADQSEEIKSMPLGRGGIDIDGSKITSLVQKIYFPREDLAIMWCGIRKFAESFIRKISKFNKEDLNKSNEEILEYYGISDDEIFNCEIILILNFDHETTLINLTDCPSKYVRGARVIAAGTGVPHFFGSELDKAPKTFDHELTPIHFSDSGMMNEIMMKAKKDVSVANDIFYRVGIFLLHESTHRRNLNSLYGGWLDLFQAQSLNSGGEFKRSFQHHSYLIKYWEYKDGNIIDDHPISYSSRKNDKLIITNHYVKSGKIDQFCIPDIFGKVEKSDFEYIKPNPKIIFHLGQEHSTARSVIIMENRAGRGIKIDNTGEIASFDHPKYFIDDLKFGFENFRDGTHHMHQRG